MTVRKRRWTKEEEDYIKDHYHKESYETMAEKLGRTKGAVIIRVHKLGVSARAKEDLKAKKRHAAKMEGMRKLDIGKTYRFRSAPGHNHEGFLDITGKVIDTTDRFVLVDTGAFKISYMYAEIGIDYIVKEV